MTGVFRKSLTLVVMLGMVLASIAAASGVAAQDDEKPTIVVGSKNYTEQIIQSEIVAQLLEDAGYTVERKYDLGGTGIAFQALQNGDIDVYVEWTGSALGAVLGMDAPEGDTREEVQDKTLELVRDEYEKQFDITWLEHWGYENTYAMAVTKETAEKYDLRKVSDLEGVAGELTLGTDQEFPQRKDGLPGLEETYGIEFGDVRPGDAGLMYSAIENGDVDIITAYTTDGRLPQLDLVLLEDDENFFPPYNPAPILRQETIEKNPGIEDVLNQVAGEISEEEMQKMNYAVDEDGKKPEDVVHDYLVEKAIVTGDED